MNDTKPTVSQVGSADSNNKDRFISLQLIPLLLLPGTPVIISSVLSICGLSSDEVDAVRAIYITPVFFLSFVTLFIAPILFSLLIVCIGIMNIVRGRRKKAITFFVMVGLNIFAFSVPNIVDVEYLRFLVKKHGYELMISNYKGIKEGEKLFVFNFDSIEDHFYFGGMNFLPYRTLIVFDESDEISMPEQSRSSEWRARANAFPILREVGSVKDFGGHYYFASTAVF